jgi:hypothetical protein
MAPTTTLHVAVLCSRKIGYPTFTSSVQLGVRHINVTFGRWTEYLTHLRNTDQPDASGYY